MKKRGDSDICKYISQLLKKGCSHQKITVWSLAGLLGIFLFVFLFNLKPSITGFAISDNSYPAVIFASADYSNDFGLIYQGLGADNKEHIYKNKNELPAQGKQKGSTNIIDYKNQGEAYYFTTGFYADADGNEFASSDLYDASNNKINTGIENVKYSASAWCDLDNNGFIDGIIIGSDDNGNKYFDIYKNEDGTIGKAYSLDGIDNGDVECFDMDSDGWKDIVACGWDINKNRIAKAYQNDRGILKEHQILEGVSSCDIEVNDFNNRGKPDFIISGQNENLQQVTYLYNSDSFQRTKILADQPLLNPSISSADYNGDGLIDLVISGNEFANPKTLFYKNNNGEFVLDNTDNAIPLKDGKLLFLNNGGLKLFSTGRDKDKMHHAQELSDFSLASSSSSAPINLSYEKTDDTYTKLTWLQPTGTKHLFYNVRVGDDINPDRYISGSNSKGNLETTPFKILKNPCLNNIDSFFFQVKAVDGAYAESDWSDKFYINCKANQTNTTLSLTGSLSITSNPSKAEIFIDGATKGATPLIIELPAGLHQIKAAKEGYLDWTGAANIETGKATELKIQLILNQTNTTEISEWTENRILNSINYTAIYNKEDGFISISETVKNIDLYPHENTVLWHSKREDGKGELIYAQDFVYTGNKYSVYIGRIVPNETRVFNLKIMDDLPSKKILPYQIDSIRFIPQESFKAEINLSNVTIEGNKTIIQLEAAANETISTGIVIKQTIPKCLIEILNEMSIKSGIIKSNRKFTILQSDPVIMWEFEDIIDKEKLELEIQAVADKNCTDKIQTEIIAKKVLARNDEGNTALAIAEIVLPVLFIVIFFTTIAKLKKKSAKKAGYWLLAIISLAILAYEIGDALSLLPATLDFLKKLMSWTSMTIFFIYLNLAGIFAGENNQKAKSFFNFLLITGYICLSAKNIVFAAFETYGKEQLFHHLALFIIQNSRIFETVVFALGIFCVVMAILTAWLNFDLGDTSLAGLFRRKEDFFIGAKLQKLLFISLLAIGFFVTIFNFFFDWLSVGVDSPFLLLVCILSFRKIKLTEADERPEFLLKTYIDLFRHEKNRFIALSSFPIFIFIIESYTYVLYFLTGIKNIYLSSLSYEIPWLMVLMRKYNYSLLSLSPYIIQVTGLIVASFLAFRFWYHFFLKREKEEKAIIDKPEHPLAFAFLAAAFFSFLMQRVFDLKPLAGSRISGMVLLFKEISQTSIIPLILTILVFVIVYTILKFTKLKFPTVLSYLLLLVIICSFTAVFTTGLGMMAGRNISDTFFGSFEPSNLYKYLNVSVLAIFFAAFAVLIFCSFIFLLIEFYAILEEEYGHLSYYRRFMRKFFYYKAKATPQHIKDIKNEYAKLSGQDLQNFHIIEIIEIKTGLNAKEIASVLADIEADGETKHGFSHIHHALHDQKLLEKLHTYIRQQYWKKNVPLALIIEQCRNTGYNDEEIAAVCLHMRHKKKDRVIFHEMKRISVE